jgi:hypothetical protein
LTRLTHACVGAGCPALFALTVSGRVQLLPAHPLDASIASAFNTHQRRLTPRGRLLGPDAAEAAVQCFRRLGAEVVACPSPWRLGDEDRDLAVEWLIGWLDAALEQEPALAPDADLYRRRRLREAATGALTVTVGHADFLVLP